MYLIITNIPEDFHSKDLRNFFSEAIEKETFVCFHFRHRPQTSVLNILKNSSYVLSEDKPTDNVTNTASGSTYGVCSASESNQISVGLDAKTSHYQTLTLGEGDERLIEEITIESDGEDKSESDAASQVHGRLSVNESHTPTDSSAEGGGGGDACDAPKTNNPPTDTSAEGGGDACDAPKTNNPPTDSSTEGGGDACYAPKTNNPPTDSSTEGGGDAPKTNSTTDTSTEVEGGEDACDAPKTHWLSSGLAGLASLITEKKQQVRPSDKWSQSAQGSVWRTCVTQGTQEAAKGGGGGKGENAASENATKGDGSGKGENATKGDGSGKGENATKGDGSGKGENAASENATEGDGSGNGENAASETSFRSLVEKLSLHEAEASKRTCCVLDVKDSFVDAFMKRYDRKHWLSRSGDILPQRCYIIRVDFSGSKQTTGAGDKDARDGVEMMNRDKLRSGKLMESVLKRKDEEMAMASTKGTKGRKGGWRQKKEEYRTRKELDALSLTSTNLEDFLEFQPPPIMPQGNVGTPTSYFKELIRTCQMPGKVIKRLGLDLPKGKGKKRFGQVPFDYRTRVMVGPEDSESQDTSIAFTASGHLIPSSADFEDQQNRKRRRKEWKKSTLRKGPRIELEKEKEDGAEVEEWERYEPFHEDVTSQDRIKERRFEEEVEVVWEKGGSGLVFYTDAQYWRAQQGDFDEQTADEWDVDMSVYYEEGAGDKDARDGVDMVNSDKLRSGKLMPSVFSKRKDEEMASTRGRKGGKRRKIGPTPPPPIGKFEAHTKGFGRRLMEAQGWQEGQGLGAGAGGMPYALEGDGQQPRDRKGLGYHGEKLSGWVASANSASSSTTKRKAPHRHNSTTSRKAPHRHHRISTVFDRTEEADPPAPPLRTQEPTKLTHRPHRN